MHQRIADLADQMFSLVYVVRNVAHYRSLLAMQNDFHQNYWILVSNNLFDIAILEWTKVFGTDENETHWKHYVSDHAGFRTGLMERLSVSSEDWAAYWKTMTGYRNDFIAHRVKDSKVQNHPKFDLALEACFYYYKILYDEFHSLHGAGYHSDLEEYFRQCCAQADAMSQVAYGATSGIPENVE